MGPIPFRLPETGDQDVHRHEPFPREEGIRGFEKVWLSRDSQLAKVPGFVEFRLLKGPEHEDFTLYASHSVWQSRATFEAWTRSAEFRAAHRDAGQNKPLYIDHPQFEGFEVRQTVRRGAAAVMASHALVSW
jgi:heme-degrading monooxygenase HmoA